jgi:hypothetical protein
MAKKYYSALEEVIVAVKGEEIKCPLCIVNPVSDSLSL